MKNSLKFTLGLSLLLAGSLSVNAQVGIGTTVPNPDSQLDITSTNRGLLLPRIALTSTALSTPLTAHVAGMTVYNTATAGDVTPGLYYNNGVTWIRLPGSSVASNDWSLLGNSGTINGVNFIGTTDNQALDIRTNNVIRGRFTNQGQLEFLNNGLSVFVGEGAGAVDDLTTNRNTFLGYEAGNDNTTGVNNIAIGFGAFDINVNGGNNVAIGNSALDRDTNPSETIAIGSGSLGSANGVVDETVAIGISSLSNSTDAVNNVAVGYRAGANVDGPDNVFLGSEADWLNANAGATQNVVIGSGAGEAGTGGASPFSGRVLIGYNAGRDSGRLTGRNNTLYIENSASPTPLLYGEFDNDILRVGGQLQIGSSDDTTEGRIYAFPTVDGTVGQALVTDGAGNLSWSEASGGAWSVTGNAGTTAANFLGTTDAADLALRTNNINRLRINSVSGNVGIGNIYQGFAKTFSFSATTGVDALVGYSTVANSYGVTGRSDNSIGVFGIDVGDGVAVQAQSASNLGVGVVAFNSAAGLGVYAQTSATANDAYGVYALIDQPTDTGAEDTAPIVGVYGSAVDGSGYSSPIAAASNSAIGGVVGVTASKFTNANQSEYLFGMIGDVLVDTSVGGAVIPRRTGGVLGTDGKGDFGILGYTAGNGTTYSVYGGGSNGNIAAGNGGRSSQSNTANNTIGIGINSGFMGGYFVGSQYGAIAKGEQFGSYTMGNTIVNSPIIQLDDVNEADRVATYASMSTTVDVTSRGKGQLKYGTVFVAFSKEYSKLIDVESINVNITPMGETKGVYVTGITEKGFTVKENMSGVSNAKFNWTVVATKKNFEKGVELSKTITSNQFENKINGVMNSDGATTSDNGTPIHFDGKDVKFEAKSFSTGKGAVIQKKSYVDRSDILETETTSNK